jgi:hypothetical protein
MLSSAVLLGLHSYETGALAIGVVLLAAGAVLIVFGRGPRDDQGKRSPRWGMYLVGIALLPVGLLLLMAGGCGETKDFRRDYLAQDQIQLSTRGDEVAGDKGLSSSVRDKLKAGALKNIEYSEIRVFSRIKEDRILVLVRAPAKMRFEKDGKHLEQSIPDDLIQAIFDDAAAALDSFAAYKGRAHYFGVRDHDHYRAVKGPDGNIDRSPDDRDRPKVLLTFYGDKPITENLAPKKK